MQRITSLHAKEGQICSLVKAALLNFLQIHGK